MLNITAGQAHALAHWITENVRAPDYDTDARGITQVALDVTKTGLLVAATGDFKEDTFTQTGHVFE